MDLKGIMLSEISHTEEDKYCYDITYVESKKITQVNLFTKQKQTHRHRKQTYGYERGKGEDRKSTRLNSVTQ